MDKIANVHWIVDVDVVRKLALIDRIDRDRDQGRDLDKAGNFQTAHLFHRDHDQGQSRCPKNTRHIFKLRVIHILTAVYKQSIIRLST